MSKIFNQMKSLEASILKERRGTNNNQQESERSPQAVRHVERELRSIIAQRPLGHGSAHRKYYAVAAALVMIAGLAAVSGIHLSIEKPPIKPQVRATSPEAQAPKPEAQAPDPAARQETAAVKQQQNEASRVRQIIQQWAEAWSRRDEAAYLSYYADDFNVPDGLTRAAWETQQKSRLRKYHTIAVTLGNIEITLTGEDLAKADFTRDFQSESYNETGQQRNWS